MRSDLLLALFGFTVAIFIFIAQGPYNNWWQYSLPAIPLVAALLLSIIVHLYRRTKGLRNALAILRGQYDLMTAVRGKSHMVVRILNDQGDIEYEREYHLEVIKNVIVATTKQEHLFTEVPLPSMPPAADLLHCSVQPQTIAPHKDNTETEQFDGRTHTHYSWYYRLENPLKKQGDTIQYRYRVSIPRSEADAFSDRGGLLFVTCGAVYVGIETTLIAPPGFAVEILQCKSIDFDGSERPIGPNLMPSINAAREVLTWTPPYAHGIRYVCYYRCKKK